MASSRWFAARHPNRDQGLMEIVVGIIWERSQRNPLVHMPEPSLGPRFVEFAGIDFVEGISCCVVVVEVKATVLRGTESRDAFFVERVYIRSDFAGVGHGACADRFQSLATGASILRAPVCPQSESPRDVLRPNRIREPRRDSEVVRVLLGISLCAFRTLLFVHPHAIKRTVRLG